MLPQPSKTVVFWSVHSPLLSSKNVVLLIITFIYKHHMQREQKTEVEMLPIPGEALPQKSIYLFFIKCKDQT